MNYQKYRLKGTKYYYNDLEIYIILKAGYRSIRNDEKMAHFLQKGELD